MCDIVNYYNEMKKDETNALSIVDTEILIKCFSILSLFVHMNVCVLAFVCVCGLSKCPKYSTSNVSVHVGRLASTNCLFVKARK